MPDPLSIVLISSLLIAVAIFAACWIGKTVRERGSAAVPPPMRIPGLSGMVSDDFVGVSGQDERNPYGVAGMVRDDPAEVSVPPPLPEKVIVWPYRAWDLIGISLITALFFSLVYQSIGAEQEKTVKLSPALLVSNIIFQAGMVGILVLAMAFRVRISEWLGLRWKHWPWVFLIGPLTVVAMWTVFAVIQVSGYMRWMESIGVETVQDTVKLLQESKDPVVIALMAAAAVIVAPVCEEIVFRGYLYGAAKKFAGAAGAALFSGIIFGMAHGSVAAMLPLCVFGVVLAVIYEKTGSIWAPMFVHFCFNAATVAVQLIVRAYGIPLDV